MEYLKEQNPDKVMNVVANKGYHRDGNYMECLEKRIIPDTYKESIEDMEVVEVKLNLDEVKEVKKNPNPQKSTRLAKEMKERAREGYFVENTEADCVHCPGWVTLYRKIIKKNGDTKYCNKNITVPI